MWDAVTEEVSPPEEEEDSEAQPDGRAITGEDSSPDGAGTALALRRVWEVEDAPRKDRRRSRTFDWRLPSIDPVVVTYKLLHCYFLYRTCPLHTNGGSGKRKVHIIWTAATPAVTAPVTGIGLRITGAVMANYRQ